MDAKRILPLVTMALAALVLVVPAPASAEVTWRDKGEVLTEAEEFLLEGPLQFSTGMPGGISCSDAFIILKLQPSSSTGTVTTFHATECVGEGAFGGCTGVADGEGLPWTIHALTDQTITITNLVVVYELFGMSCLKKSASINSSSGAFFNPTNPAAISKLQWNGTVSTSLGVSATLAGSMVPSNPKEVGTYGIE